MEKRIKSFDKINIAYFDNRIKSKTAIIFLHGWLGNRKNFFQYYSYFTKKNIRVIGIDLRGHGKTDAPLKKESYEFKLIAKDIDAILSKEKIETATLFGYSMGGMIALSYYKAFPKKVKSLVLVSTSYKSPIENEKSKKQILALKKYTKKTKYIKQSRSEKEILQKDYLVYSLKKAKELVKSHDSAFFLLEQIFEFDYKIDLPKVKVPTILLYGNSDFMIPKKHMVFMAQTIKKAEFLEFDSDHNLPFKKVEVIKRVLFNFFK